MVGEEEDMKERGKREDENWYQWKNSSGQGNLKGGPCYESPKQERFPTHLNLNPKPQSIQQSKDINSVETQQVKSHNKVR